jgi:hypothetical protein
MFDKVQQVVDEWLAEGHCVHVAWILQAMKTKHTTTLWSILSKDSETIL